MKSVFYHDPMKPKSPVRSVLELEPFATSWLDEYCESSSRYAWPSYDIDVNPNQLLPTDLLSPAFLSYPIQQKYLQPMLIVEERPGPYRQLFDAMKRVVDASKFETDRFEDVAIDRIWSADESPWGLFVSAVQATEFKVREKRSGLTIVAVSKILHRKRSPLGPSC